MKKGRFFNILKSVLFFICLALCAYMVFTLVWISSYSVLVADDFSHGLEVGAFNEPFFPYLLASVRFVKATYFGCSGAYFTMFLQALLSPINHFGLSQLRIVMAVNSCFFFISLFVFFHAVMKKYGIKDRTVIMFLITLVVFPICGYQTYPEVFFWFSGATGYGFPMSMLLLALACIIEINEDNKNAYFWLAIIFGVCAVGGNLTVSGAGCYVALLIILYKVVRGRKFPQNLFCVFITWFIGALVNALAPGQFNRHDMIDDSGLHIGTAICNSFIMVKSRWLDLLGYNFLLLLMLVFICGIVIGKERDTFDTTSLIFSFAGLLTPIVTAFPLALGTSKAGIPNRCAFVVDVDIIISSMNLMLILGFIIYRVLTAQMRTVVITVLAMAMLIYCKYDGYGLSDFKTYELNCQQAYGVYSEHYYNHVEFYKWVKEQRGQDVVVTPEHCPYGIDNVHNLYLFNDPNEWVNDCVAQYCGVNSIRTDYD